MIQLSFAGYAPRIKAGNGGELIYDPYRRKWLLLTPEEWVRQNFLYYLVTVKGYPASLIAIEKSIRVGALNKRFDILVYKDELPFMIVECKEPEVKLSEDVLLQVLRYNTHMQARYVI